MSENEEIARGIVRNIVGVNPEYQPATVRAIKEALDAKDGEIAKLKSSYHEYRSWIKARTSDSFEEAYHKIVEHNQDLRKEIAALKTCG